MLMSSTRARHPLVPLVAIVVGLTAAACGDDDDAADEGGGSGGATVAAANFAFDPSELTVGAGATITLRNDDDVEHSFTIDDPAVDAEAEGGEEATATAPDEAGTYPFYCRYHPQMTGTLTVD